jgi:hypothetical protein
MTYYESPTLDRVNLLDGRREDADWFTSVRIVNNVDIDANGCWNWRRSLTVGYGRIRVAGRLDLCHRVTYRLWVGDLIDGMQIDHLCFNRACCNPAHLEQVTPIVNQHRSSPPQTHCHKGHEFTPANCAPRKDGRHDCKACRAERQRAWRAANPTWRDGVAA